MPKLLSLALQNVKEALLEPPDREVAKLRTGISVTDKAKLSLDAAATMADRLGMSPAATIINLQQNNNNKTVIAPLFEQAPDAIDAVFTVEHDVYPSKPEEKE
jgi:hypothetical protein